MTYFSQDGVTETRFPLGLEQTNKIDKTHGKNNNNNNPQFSRHWVSGNEQQ